MNKEEVTAFDEWAAYYYSWEDRIPSQEEMRIALDAWEAGFNYAKKLQQQGK